MIRLTLTNLQSFDFDQLLQSIDNEQISVLIDVANIT